MKYPLYTIARKTFISLPRNPGGFSHSPSCARSRFDVSPRIRLANQDWFFSTNILNWKLYVTKDKAGQSGDFETEKCYVITDYMFTKFEFSSRQNKKLLKSWFPLWYSDCPMSKGRKRSKWFLVQMVKGPRGERWSIKKVKSHYNNSLTWKVWNQNPGGVETWTDSSTFFVLFIAISFTGEMNWRSWQCDKMARGGGLHKGMMVMAS